LNNTHDPTFSRGAIVFQIDTSTVQLAGALNPGDLGRTGSIVYPSSPVTIDAPVQLSIGGAQCPLTPDSPLSFVIIIDSISVGSVVYQATYPFPTIQVAYPLQAQDIYGVTTIHGEAQVNPSPDSSATVTWTVSNDSSGQRSNQPADIDITGYSGVAYVKATATNKYGSTESDSVQIWIDPMNTPAGNNVYTQYGGTLTVIVTPEVDSSFYDPTNSMQLTLNNIPILSSSVLEANVNVTQWDTLNFKLYKKGHELAPGGNLQIINSYGYVYFDETDYFTSYTFELSLTIDSTQQTLPPNWLYGNPFNYEDPFDPSPTVFIAPVSGELKLEITSSSTAAVDTLFLQSPVKKFILTNPAGNLGDTVDCGEVAAGDTIQFYLHSNDIIDADLNMYPEITLPDTGGVMASTAVKGGSKGGVSPLNQRKLFLKPHAGGKSLPKELFTEKIKSSLTGSPSSTSSPRPYRSTDPSGVVGLQQKKVQAQGAKHDISNPSIVIIGPGPGITNPVTALTFEDWTDLDFNDVTASAWIVPAHTILLGETKYYTAILDPNDNSKLIIRESSDPDLGNGNSGVIFEDPVASASDDKVGTYFDYNNPDGNGLDNGVIRLIGRYLKSGASQNYTVTLHAVLKSENRDEYIDIDVKRPSSLGSTHSTANDVDGQTYNLDKLIIDNAGQAGVFPQYIKAIIQVESMSRFDPCYRYEPFKDMAVLQQKDKRTQKYIYESNMYRILSATDKGTPPIPTDPKNLRDPSANPMPEYPGYIMVWDFYQAGLNKTWYTAKHYKFLEYEWKKVRAGLPKELFGKEETQLSSNENKIASDSTDSRIFRWLQYEYQGGMAGKIAQTRLAASYGIMQVVYSGSSVYPQNDQQFLPESLSVASTSIEYGVKTLVSKFHLKSVVGKNFDNATWSSGLETSYGNALFQYNRSRDYPPQVVSLLPNYMPNP
jgi:hypothetical protein